MWTVRDAVDDGPCAGAMHQIGDLAYRVHGRDDVRAVRERDDTRARTEQGFEVRHVEIAGVRVDLPLTHDHSGTGEPRPGANVGFVVLVRDDHLVPRLQVLTQRLRDDVGVL